MSAGITLSEAKIGAGRIFWGPAGSETELGLTKQGIKVGLSVPVVDIKSDEYGEEPVGEVSAGTILTVAFDLMQFDRVQLLAAVPGSVSGTGTGANISWNAGVRAGLDMTGTAYAKRMRWHPIQTTDTASYSGDWIFHKVALRAQGEVPLNNAEARTIVVVGQCFRDTSITTEAKQLCAYGTDS
jgi:hypothetical protein